MRLMCFLLGVCWMVVSHPTPAQQVEEEYEILSNRDTVCWRYGGQGRDSLFFLKDVSRYKLEEVRQRGMDYNQDAVGMFFWKAELFNAYVKKHYATLTNFCFQMLTYEERKALINSNGDFYFHCAVDTNGRVVLIPYISIPHGAREAFSTERLYEYTCHIKNICQFPLPPASMTMGCMFLYIALSSYFLEEGMFYERSCGYY